MFKINKKIVVFLYALNSHFYMLTMNNIEYIIIDQQEAWNNINVLQEYANKINNENFNSNWHFEQSGESIFLPSIAIAALINIYLIEKNYNNIVNANSELENKDEEDTIESIKKALTNVFYYLINQNNALINGIDNNLTNRLVYAGWLSIRLIDIYEKQLENLNESYTELCHTIYEKNKEIEKKDDEIKQKNVEIKEKDDKIDFLYKLLVGSGCITVFLGGYTVYLLCTQK